MRKRHARRYLDLLVRSPSLFSGSGLDLVFLTPGARSQFDHFGMGAGGVLGWLAVSRMKQVKKVKKGKKGEKR